MTKRIAATVLWFVAIWMTYGFAAFAIDLPDFGGIIAGAIAATIIWVDPTRRLWVTSRT
jgi:hypothetical protein